MRLKNDKRSNTKTQLKKHIKHTCTLMATNFSFSTFTNQQLFLITFCPSVQRQKRLMHSSHNVKGKLCPMDCEQVAVIQRRFDDWECGWRSEVSSRRKAVPPGEREEFSPAMVKLFRGAYLLFFIPMRLTHASYHAASVSKQLALHAHHIRSAAAQSQ